jgi:hypothetical protein
VVDIGIKGLPTVFAFFGGLGLLASRSLGFTACFESSLVELFPYLSLYFFCNSTFLSLGVNLP